MWNEKLQARADEMKVREANARAAEAHLIEWRKAQAGSRKARINWLKRQKEVEKQNLRREARRERKNARKREIWAAKRPSRKLALAGKNKSASLGYPPCPQCEQHNAKKNGFNRGKQRYQCRVCGAKFIETSDIEREAILGTCFRCGRDDCRTWSAGKCRRLGFCESCERTFTHGGSEDFERYHLLLKQRCRQEQLPADIEAEILQMATVDVLEGRGYCWNVELKIRDAWRAVRGDMRYVELKDYR